MMDLISGFNSMEGNSESNSAKCNSDSNSNSNNGNSNSAQLCQANSIPILIPELDLELTPALDVGLFQFLTYPLDSISCLCKVSEY